MTKAEKTAATLRKSGQAMVLTRSSSGAYDPITGVTSAPVVQSWTVYGITKGYRDGIINAPGTTIISGDKKAVISADVVGPVPGDTLTIMGVVWQVIAIDTLSPQGEAMMHFLQVRK